MRKVWAVVSERREVELSLALHHAAVPYLRRDWARAKPIIQHNLDRYAARDRAPIAQAWVTTWQDAVDIGPEAVIQVALTPGERGNDLRQMTPLAGVLPQAERLRVITDLQTKRTPK